MLAETLKFRRNADFWRIAEEWGEAECRAHAGCLNLEGTTLLHLAVEHCDSTRGDITIVETILDWGAPLEAMNWGGTALAIAIEFQHWPVVRLLISRGADRVSPCTPGGRHTPLSLAQDYCNDAPEILALIRDGPVPLSPPSADADDQPQSSKKQKQSKDGGSGIHQADFGSFGKSISKLWAEYTDILRLRSQTDAHWFGEGVQNRANRNYYHRKCVFYREIARQYELNASNIEVALTAVQAFVGPYFGKSGGGWKAAELKLREITPAEGWEASRLDEMCKAL